MGAENVQTIQLIGIYPPCMKCGRASLVPLSDYGTDGAGLTFKAWACSDPRCGFQVRVDKGVVKYDTVDRG
jgi:hypothetical protein